MNPECSLCGEAVSLYGIHTCVPQRNEIIFDSLLNQFQVAVDPSVPPNTILAFSSQQEQDADLIVNMKPLDPTLNLDPAMQDLVTRAIGAGMKTPEEMRADFVSWSETGDDAIRKTIDGYRLLNTSTANAASFMQEMNEAITKLREAELAEEELMYESKLGALAAVLRRRPIRLDARSEVISYLHENFAPNVPVEPWQTGAFYGGTTINLDDDLEPGVVRAHFRADPLGLIATQEIVIGDL